MWPNLGEWLIILGVALLFAALTDTTVQLDRKLSTCDEPVVGARRSQPEICAPFYNDGTGRWAECMGVGPK